MEGGRLVAWGIRHCTRWLVRHRRQSLPLGEGFDAPSQQDVASCAEIVTDLRFDGGRRGARSVSRLSSLKGLLPFFAARHMPPFRDVLIHERNKPSRTFVPDVEDIFGLVASKALTS
jgi:hypothetical protein